MSCAHIWASSDVAGTKGLTVVVVLGCPDSSAAATPKYDGVVEEDKHGCPEDDEGVIGKLKVLAIASADKISVILVVPIEVVVDTVGFNGVAGEGTGFFGARFLSSLLS